MHVPANAKRASISAVVIRADGTREDRGVLTCWHRNLIERLRCAIGKRRGRPIPH